MYNDNEGLYFNSVVGVVATKKEASLEFESKIHPIAAVIIV